MLRSCQKTELIATVAHLFTIQLNCYRVTAATEHNFDPMMWKNSPGKSAYQFREMNVFEV